MAATQTLTAQSGAAATKGTAAKTAGKLAEAEMEGGREAVREGGRETAREMVAKKGATAKGAGMKGAAAKGIPAAGATKGFVAGGAGKGAGLAAKAGTTVAGAKTAAAGSALVPVKGLGLGLGLGVWGPVILGVVATVAIFGYVSSRKVEKGQSDEEIELADALVEEG